MRCSFRTACVVAGLVLAGPLAGCGPQEQGAAPGTGTTSSASPSGTAPSSPSPSAAPAAPSVPPSKGKPDSPGILSVTGTVEAGVEAGCLLLRPKGDGPVYLLIGGDRTVLTAGSEVTVRGYAKPGLMSTCQQGTPFEVVEAKRA